MNEKELYKEFPVISITRADLEEANFDISNVSDDVMKLLAQKMYDEYVSNFFWDSLNSLARYLKIPDKTQQDRDGDSIHVGDFVIWYDPDEENRDLSIAYKVLRMNGEVILIGDGVSEAEVFAHELKIVHKSEKYD